MDQFIKNLARGAGAILRDGFHKKMKVSQKENAWDFVTEYDVRTEKFIIDKIQKKFPGHGIMGEESGRNGNRKNFWIIDPLDGTHAFIKGTPQFSTTFSFVSGNKIKYGVVYDPIHDELFFAKVKGGTTLNNKRISVSGAKNLQYVNMAAYVATRMGNVVGTRLRKFIYNEIVLPCEMWNDTTSSVALAGAYVSCGRFDIVYSKGLNPWDLSASALLMQEAGGKISDHKGRAYQWDGDELLGTNPLLHKGIVKVFKGYND